MDDLIIKVNIDETNQHHNLIIDTFLGTIKIFKNQQYSGQLRKVDIFSNQISSQKKLNELLDILRENETRQLASHKHMIYAQNVINFFSIANKLAAYYGWQKSAMYRITSFVDKPVEFFIRRSLKDKSFEAYIEFGQSTKIVSIEARLVALNKQIFLFNHNTVYLIRELVNATSLPLNVNFINFIIEHAWKPTESQITRYLHQLCNNTTSSHTEKTITVCNSLPIPVLYLYFDIKGTISASLKFRYDAIEIDYNSAEEFVIFDQQKFYRDKKNEFEYVSILNQYNWKKSFKNLFIYQGQFIVEDVDLLLEKGFIILSENKTKVVASSAYSHHMNYGIDWFYLNTNIHVNDKTYSLAKLLNLKNKQQRWIEIDNHIVLLPKELIEHNNILSVNSGKIVISKKNIGDALELAEALSIKKIDNIESIIAFENIKLDIPTDLLLYLRAYQIDGVKWLLYLYQNSFGGCLADDMGLGKTIQVIAFLSDQKIKKNQQPSLIIVPKTLLFNWKNELEKFNPELKIEIYYGSARAFEFPPKYNIDIILTTYGTVLHDIEQLSRLSYNCIIIDEAQYIKNNNSKTYRAVSLLSSQIKLALTGTPIENNIGELWSLMNLLNPKIWETKKIFINQYLQKIERLKIKISPFVLRRTKKQVLHDLPEKIESIIYCDMDEEQSSLYNALLLNIKQEMAKLPGRFEIKTNAYILRGLMHLRQVCCHPMLLDAHYNINRCKTSAKFEVLQGIVNELYYKGEKVVIFSQFTTMLKILEKWLKQEQYQYFYLDGQTNNREAVISKFEESANGILLISLKAGGVGINLTSASYAVIYDPWWNPAAENQAADRLYRIGQKRNVTIYKLITVNSIEEKVDELKKMKLNLFDQVLEGQDMIESLTIEDLKRLL